MADKETVRDDRGVVDPNAATTDRRVGTAGTRELRPEPAAGPKRDQKQRPGVVDGKKPRRRGMFVLIAIAAWLTATLLFGGPAGPVRDMPLNEFRDELDAGTVVFADLSNGTETIDIWICGGDWDVDADDRDDTCDDQKPFHPEKIADFEPVGTQWNVGYPYRLQGELAEELLDANIAFTATPTPPGSSLLFFIQLLLPILLIGGVFFLLLPALRGGGGFSKFKGNQDKAREIPSTRLADVAGVDEVVEELNEVVAFLKNPKQFAAVGARPPRGLLLVGPPGTGKTLLARAVAGEAQVPFFAVSGSDFIEVFAGTGAARVRELFSKARKAGAAIIFIDELDAIGRSRSQGQGRFGGADSEREQTLNQLLVELDGFAADAPVFVLAATNRADVLDSALMRSGRFDRRVEVPPPDKAGRATILALHAGARPLGSDVALEAVAASTPGFTGADLANLVNQAALSAARDGSETIDRRHFDDAVGILVLGPERRSRVMDPAEQAIVAVHEAGHTVAALMQDEITDPVRVTIVPRGGAGGATWVPPSDQTLMSYPAARAQLIVAMAGRAAEGLVCDSITQGASGDIASATDLARQMVCAWGMSSLGEVRLEPDDYRFGQLGDRVHSEIRELITTASAAAEKLLVEYRDLLDAVAAELLDTENVDRERLVELVVEAGYREAGDVHDTGVAGVTVGPGGGVDL